ncbi:MAG: glycosyltransferase [Treponemataceae bacterium]
MIPKLIHQTAKDASIPAEWVSIVAAARALHPDWKYRLWTDADSIALIREKRPKLAAVFDAVPRKVMRADIIRCFLMEQYGGLYFDLDYEFLKPFAFAEKLVVLPRESDDDQPVFLGNAVFASERGHSFWTAILDRIETYSFNEYSEISEEDVIDLTGPGLVTEIYRNGFLESDDIFIPRHREFNPSIPKTLEEREFLILEGVAYGIHYCHGSWRALTKKQRIIAKIKKYGKRLIRLLKGVR